MKDSRVLAVLISGILGMGLLWVTFTPTAVTRAEMRDYVSVTATEHLRLLREDFKETQEVLIQVRERLARVEAIVREKTSG